jgi:hypothetical protein
VVTWLGMRDEVVLGVTGTRKREVLAGGRRSGISLRAGGVHGMC